MPPSSSSAATTTTAASTSAPSRARAQQPSRKSNASPVADDSSMAVAPYVPPAAHPTSPNNGNGFLSDLGLQFGGANDDASTNANMWDFSDNSFLHNAQIEDQQGMAIPSQSVPTSLQQQQQQISLNAAMANGTPSSSMFTSALQSGAVGAQQTSHEAASPPHLSTSRPTASQIPSHVAKNNPFLNKLRSMVDDPKTDDLIRWSDKGDTFLVPNHIRFGDEILPRFFKHKQFSSFVRQLNMYGFRKVPHLQQGALKSDPGQETELWEFQNDNFLRDHPEQLLKMQRKKGVRVEDEVRETPAKGKADEGSAITLDAINGALTRAQRGEGDGALLQLASVWSAIQSMQAAQQSINDNLRHLHNTNTELWREAAEQRARSKKQEETINKMLRFLAGVFGAQDVNNIGGNHRPDTASPASASGTPRRSNGVLRPHDKSRRRLLIGDGSSNGGQIEELEVPPAEDENDFAGDIEELTPHGRITEARSGTNSPQTDTSPPARFINLPNTPSNGKQTSLPSIASDAAPTPGGGRRISQQAGAQLLSALASGEAQSWLANMFGQQQAGASAQSPGTRNDNLNSAAAGSSSFKLDSQTLSALQGILAAGAGNADPGAQQANSYFDGAAGAPGVNAAQASQQQPNWPPQAVSPRTRPANVPDRAQLVRSNSQVQNELQGVSQDATAVQNALNALVEGLRLENLTGAQPYPQGAPVTSSGLPVPPTATAPSVTTPSRGMSGADMGGGASNADVDVDSLLKEFLNESGISLDGSAASGSGNDAADAAFLNGVEGETPAFAFSPAPDGDGVGQEDTSGAPSTVTSAGQSRAHSPTTRKRKLLDESDGMEASPTARMHGGKTKSVRQ